MNETKYILTNQNNTNAPKENTDDTVGKSAREESGKLEPVDKKSGPEKQALMQVEASSRCTS